MILKQTTHEEKVVDVNDLLTKIKELLNKPKYQDESKIVRICYNKDNPLITANAKRRLKYYLLNNIKAKVYFQCMENYLQFTYNLSKTRAVKLNKGNSDPKYHMSPESTDIVCICINSDNDYELYNLYLECIKRNSRTKIESITILSKG